MSIIRTIYITFLLVLYTGVSAKEYSFETLTSNNGLSQNDVITVFQDSQGFIWFGTIDGLNRYDGYEFKVFRSNANNPNSISGNMISKIVEDNNHNLWIGTLTNGVSKFNLITEEFTHIKNTDEEPDLLTRNYIRDISFDSNNNIWLGTLGGINVLSEKPDGSYKIQKIIKQKNDSRTLRDNEINAISIDSKGRIWVCSNFALDLLKSPLNKGIKNNFHHIIDSEQPDIFNCVLEVEEGHLLSSNIGLKFIKLDSINPENSQIISLDNFALLSLEEDKYGNVWASSSDGLLLYEKQNNKEKPYKRSKHFKHNESPGAISHDFIRSLDVDNSGIVWVGTNGGGVSKYNPTKTKFRHYNSTGAKGSLSASKVWCIYEDQQNNIWFGTEGGGLNFLAADKNKDYKTGFTHFDVNPSGQQNFAFQIIDVSQGKNPLFWVGVGQHNQLMEVASINNSWSVKPVEPEPDNFIMTLCLDEFGTIWAGSYYGALQKYLPAKSGKKIINYTIENSIIPSNIIRSITEDSKGRLWIGTPEGLMLLTREQKRKENLEFTLFKTKANDSTSISHNYVVPVFETSYGDILVGTFGGGLNRYIEGETSTIGSFRKVFTEGVLPNNTIKHILEDKNGDIWISTNKGISRYSPLSGEVRNFDLSDGLQALEFTDLSGIVLSDGEILFGGPNGFNAFYPKEIFEDTIPPKVVFTAIEINHTPIEVGAKIDGVVLLQENLNSTKSIDLSHSQNTISIHFAALQFADPYSNQYMYMLEGVDKDWVRTPSTSRFVRYTNLENGKYLFKVKASNSDGIWSKESKELQINIVPPFWLTTWFRLVLIVLGFLVIITIVLFRFYLIKLRNDELEIEVRKRTSEIRLKNEQLEKQTNVLNNTNTQLVERQKLVREQADKLEAQKDTLIEQSKILRAQKNDLEETNTTKDKFYSILAHDLKGPFTTLTGYLDLLYQKYDKFDDTQKRRRIKTVQESAHLILNLVQNLLQWSRSQRGLIPFNPEEIAIELEVNQILSLYDSRLIEKDITISYEQSEEFLKVPLDSQMFNAILRNLVSNAIKYTTRGGVIKIGAVREEAHVLVFVEDNGVGIPADMIDKLFRIDNKYTTVGTDQETGTGLGLILCKEFVDAHKGKIWAESEAGNGTTIFFTIPLQG